MISHAALPLVATIMQLVMWNLPLFVAALIVLLCLVLYGGGDLIRLSPLRMRAVASVCFHESIRRRVLWLTPLAVLGVVLVSQFQRPLDEQDAIRQATRFCVFTAGLLVVMATIILACTNLPREIENRVVYTIVTKPISRLEILLGKIAGFSAVSALILVIMGVFAWGYLKVQEWRLIQDINQQISVGGLDPATEQTLKYYRDHGLLNARDYRGTFDVQSLSTYPGTGDKMRWFNGGSEQMVLVPFRVDPASLTIGEGDAAMAVAISLSWVQQRPMTPDELQNVTQMTERNRLQGKLPPAPAGTASAPAEQQFPAFVRVEFYTPDFQRVPAPDEKARGTVVPLVDSNGRTTGILPVSQAYAQQLLSMGSFYVSVLGVSPGVRFGVGDAPAKLLLPSNDPQKPIVIQSQKFNSPYNEAYPIVGRTAQNGQQLRGDDAGTAPVGVFAFRNRDLPTTGTMTVEIRTVVDEQGVDRRKESVEQIQQPAIVELSVVNRQTGKVSGSVHVPVESRRTGYAELPAEYLAGGNFDILVRSLTPDHWIGLTPATIRLAAGDGSFVLNLFKSYLILWLLSVLVIIVAIFCSTFLSWPIAVVLTVVILLGHWGVTQLGEMASPGVGRQVVNDLFSGAAPAVTETLTRSMESLASLTRTFASFLPDISQFTAMEEIIQGAAIPSQRLVGSLIILVLFGLEILALSYVFFRNKEVAP